MARSSVPLTVQRPPVSHRDPESKEADAMNSLRSSG